MRESILAPRPSPLGPRPSVTGLVLAGGQGRRMGGVDKGLQLLEGRPLVAWALERLAPQVDEVLISANRNREAYAAFGHRVIADEYAGFAGPLAGMHAGLTHARHDLVAAVPCDSPFLPEDIVNRLAAPLAASRVDATMARTGTRIHPVFCIVRKGLAPHLIAFLEKGGRKFDAWFATLNVAEVAFDDCAEAFANINTLEDLKAADARRT
ncbi:MAG: molybdenum cofactor guanylyltransferase MobA [Betaproteobacteria bacterium]